MLGVNKTFKYNEQLVLYARAESLVSANKISKFLSVALVGTPCEVCQGYCFRICQTRPRQKARGLCLTSKVGGATASSDSL